MKQPAERDNMKNFTALNPNPVCPLCEGVLPAGTPLSLHMAEAHVNESQVILRVLGEVNSKGAMVSFYKNLYHQMNGQDVEVL